MPANQSPAGSASDSEIVSTRVFAASPPTLFNAFIDPTRLVQWWGPKGFTNTCHQFDPRPGGFWQHTLHGPDGANYDNGIRFLEVVPAQRIVFVHEKPVRHFQMTMTFVPQERGTALTWRMLFESADEVAKLKEFIVPANEQNFDRLAAHLAKHS